MSSPSTGRSSASSKKNDEEMTVVEKYPPVVFNSNRAKIKMIIENSFSENVTYNWRDCPEPTGAEMVAYKEEADFHFRKHLVVFTTRCVVSLLVDLFPSIDVSSNLMGALRKYLMTDVGDNIIWEFAFVSCYVRLSRGQDSSHHLLTWDPELHLGDVQ